MRVALIATQFTRHRSISLFEPGDNITKSQIHIIGQVHLPTRGDHLPHGGPGVGAVAPEGLPQIKVALFYDDPCRPRHLSTAVIFYGGGKWDLPEKESCLPVA